MTEGREGNRRAAWLTVVLVLLSLAALGIPNRLLTQWTYAIERGRLQADSEKLALVNQDLARVEEVSHAFRLVARVAQPGVVHIHVPANADAAQRIADLEQEERQMRRLLDELVEQHADKPTEEPSLESILELLRRLGEAREEIQMLESLARSASGSGIVFDADGHILTNNHVIDGRSRVSVQLPDEREYEATVIGADRNTDLAMIKIEASELHPLKFGNSDQVQVGDWVIAVGAPFGLSQTVTHGIISATGRNDVVTGRGIVYQNFLQTDAAINPGNSGGPLLNLRGEVIGVNTAIATHGDAYNAGIAFTIPATMAVKIANQLKETGQVARGWLGITMGELTAADRQIFQVEGRQGVLVDAVIEGAPADQAGILVEDVILTVNGEPVSNMAELRGLIADVLPDDGATFDLLRGGERRAITVKLGRRPDDREFASTRTRARRAQTLEALGLYARTLLPDYASRLGYSDDARGVLVLGNIETEADTALIKPEELIVACNGRSVETVAALLRMLQDVAPDKPIKLDVVNAEGERRTVRYPPK